jgi:Na+/proline symporter
VAQALAIFYAILGATLFVPIVGGLVTRRTGQPEALAAIVAGVGTLFTVGFALTARPRWMDPALSGIVAAAVAFTIVLMVRRDRA